MKAGQVCAFVICSSHRTYQALWNGTAVWNQSNKQFGPYRPLSPLHPPEREEKGYIPAKGEG